MTEAEAEAILTSQTVTNDHAEQEVFLIQATKSGQFKRSEEQLQYAFHVIERNWATFRMQKIHLIA